MEEDEKRYFENMSKTWTEYITKVVEESSSISRAIFDLQMNSLKHGLPKVEDERVTGLYREWQEITVKNTDKIREMFEKAWGEERNIYEKMWETLKASSSTMEGGNEYLKDQMKAWSAYMDRMREFYDTKNLPSIDTIYRESMSKFFDSNTKLMNEFLRSPAFVSMLGRQLDLTLDLRKNIEEQATEMWHAFGIPTRNDFDQMAKRMYELSHRIDELENRKEGSSQQEVNETKAGA